MDRDEPQGITVEVAYCPRPGEADRVALAMSPGSTAGEALAASGLCERHALATEGLRLGVWGKLRDADTALRDGDRVEVYRPLTVDPKEARRQRYQQHKETLARRAAAGKPTGPL